MAAGELAIYDLDRTITRSGTYTPFLLFWARKKAPWRLLLTPVALVVMGAYATKLISRKRLKEVMQRLLMGRQTKANALAEIVDAFARRTVRDGIYPEAAEAIIADRAAGRRVIVATAAFDFYVRPIARMLNITDVVATRSHTSEGGVLARIEGENCYGPEKLSMLETYLKEAGIDRNTVRIRFYSDHSSDLPVFSWVDEPIAVNPSPRLKTVATERGWRVLDWRT